MKVSKCCQSTFRSEGNTTQFYVCDACETACDVFENGVKLNTAHTINQLIQSQKQKLGDDFDINDINDGYHTFGELYKHRIHLFIALCKSQLRLYRLEGNCDIEIIKSKLHDDGSSLEGWFIVQMGILGKNNTQISYHLPIEYWEECNFITATEKANKWDGHTSDDVLERLFKI